ncbi:nuclease-related domain-containing protein [Psychrobacillus sp. FJAT-51614]|uniref:Nuclease-related domain-containing protein n=1 Tax=Psychrobacillus mangrovi TaxID=3117745 RepID=A0ABU8F1L9_9BACI
MIVKKYSTTPYTEALKVLIKRLNRNHPRYLDIKEEIRQKTAGDIGEEAVMRILEQVKLPYRFYVFHNISLFSESLIQMDVLIITPYYALILEVKNIRGELTFTTNPSQLIRQLENGEINVFDSPVIQLEEYEYQLNLLFQKNNIPLPIFGAITFAFSTSYIKASPLKTTILTRKQIKPFLRKMKTGKPLLTNNELDNLKNYILKAHKEFQPFPLISYISINPDSIIQGVECSYCSLIGMKKVQHNWFCPKCKNYQRNAHEKTLIDYFLIYKNTMSNIECQHFLKLDNKHQATRILKNTMLVKTGRSRNTKYNIRSPQ